SIRANPIDAVVLLCGCDKTTPALIMGAASCDVPAIVVSGGPMLNGKYCGRNIGSGTDVWRFDAMVKAGIMSETEFREAETCMSRSAGHCMTMGTASTMASMVEALGLGLPGNAAIPAVDSRRSVLAHMAGRRIVDMAREDVRISTILTRKAFENAIRVNAAVGGSTNAVIHHLAMAGRVGVKVTLEDWDRLGRDVPTLVDLMPSGRFLMEDFFYAGGLPAVIRTLDEHGMLHRDAVTVNGKTLTENCKDAPNWNSEVIRPFDKPLVASGGVAVLRGNLAPEGGNMALPPKILQKGVTDMVRLSDARMSGTAYGTVVLHVCPEAAVGGNLALVQDGDFIELDVPARKLHLDVSDDVLDKRRAVWKPPAAAMDGGYQKLYVDHVQQASCGADLDFLIGCRGDAVPRESH